MTTGMKTALGIGLAAALMGFVACTSVGAMASAQASQTGVAPNTCINPIDIKTQKIVSDQEIQFGMKNGDVWTNKLHKACFGLKIQGGFKWDVLGTQVCSNQQRINVINTDTPCQLGDFTKAPAKAG